MQELMLLLLWLWLLVVRWWLLAVRWWLLVRWLWLLVQWWWLLMKLLLYNNRLMVVWFLVRSFILFENQWRRIRNGLAMLLCRGIQNNCFLVVWINGGCYSDQRNIGVIARERRNGKKT